jgi:hypothetical protein
MPVGCPIQAVPNQSLSITLDGNVFELTIKSLKGITVVSVTINGVDTIDNLIAAACAPIIPAQYLEAGNFVFLTANNQLPFYTQFGTTQSLFYFTAAELAALRTAPVATSARVPTVTASFFNPAGQLPLRFAPQNYRSAS